MSVGREYFGCSQYRGAQLEDLTGNDDHLEKKLYYNDVMTGDLTTNSGVNRIILMFFFNLYFSLLQ